MKKLLKSIIFIITSTSMLFSGTGVGVYNYTDNFPPSRSHPENNSISIENVPMFIVLGFDDNGIADISQNGGMTWIKNFLRDKKNPAGNGNDKTYDGSFMRASFYMTAKYGQETIYESASNVRQVWNDLYNDGHEIGNHSTFHLGYWDSHKQEFISFNGSMYSTNEWLEKEINPCHTMLSSVFNPQKRSKGIGILESDLYGWRTPRLEWNDDVLKAIKEKGYVYDCSIESGGNNDGRSLYWPFTLDNGHPFQNSVSKYPGLWEMPCYSFYIPSSLQSKSGSKSIITGLDYNVWVTKKYGEENPEFNGPEFTEILNHTLDLRMEGNRCPMLIGLHSDIYSSLKDEEYPGTKNARARQLAIENFIDYAIQTYPEVRVVSAIDVINWMRNPVELNHEKPISHPRHYTTNRNFRIHALSLDKIEYSVPSSGEYSIRIYSIKGALIHNFKVNATDSGKNSAHWESNGIHNGSYLVVLQGQEGKTSTHINFSE